MIRLLRGTWLLGLALCGGSTTITGAAIGLAVLLMATLALKRVGDW